jgi:hypothetical protein
METVTVVDKRLVEIKIKNISIVCLGKAPVGSVFLKYALQYRIVDIPNPGVKYFSAATVGSVIGVYDIGI